jgi:hypothetical protein
MVVETQVEGTTSALELCAVNAHRRTERFIAALKKAALIFIIFEAVTAERLTTSFQELMYQLDKGGPILGININVAQLTV